MNYETPNGNTPLDTNLPFPENNLPLYPEDTLLPCPSNMIATSGFLQVVPPESAAPLPPQPVPEEFPLTVAPDPETLFYPGTAAPVFPDLFTRLWSDQTIKEISSQCWFRYEKDDSLSFTVIDGNSRKLFSANEEGIAAFAVKAMNLYVMAAMSTQV